MPSSTAQVNADLEQLIAAPTWFLGVSTVLPSDADGTGFAEPADGAYARVAVPPASWAAAASGVITTDTDLQTVAAGEDWGTVVAYGLFADDVEVLPRRWQRLAQAQTVSAGGRLVFPAGSITARGAL